MERQGCPANSRNYACGGKRRYGWDYRACSSLGAKPAQGAPRANPRKQGSGSGGNRRYRTFPVPLFDRSGKKILNRDSSPDEPAPISVPTGMSNQNRGPESARCFVMGKRKPTRPRYQSVTHRAQQPPVSTGGRLGRRESKSVAVANESAEAMPALVPGVT